MNQATAACDRFEAALAHEGPQPDAGWAAHVAGCTTCRELAELDARLNARLRSVEPEDGRPELEGDRPRRLVAQAFATLERRNKRRRAALIGTGLAAALVAGVTLGRTGARGTADEGDALSQAAALLAGVLPPGGAPRPARLQEDPDLVARCQVAVREGRGVVRRAALTVLGLGKVDLDSKTLEEVLRTWNEELESTVAVASAGGNARFVAEALDLRRTATLQEALRAAWWQASRGRGCVASGVVLPFLAAPDAGVRQQALLALAADDGFAPTEAVKALLRDRSEPVAVRQAAAECLLRRAGEAGASLVVASLQGESAEELERACLHSLLPTAAGRAFARERITDPAAPLGLALLHARHLGRDAGLVVGERLLAGVLASGSLDHAAALVEACRSAHWDGLRGALQQLWTQRRADWKQRDAQGTELVVRTLVQWDDESGDPRRWEQALEVCEQMSDILDRRTRAFLERLEATAPDAGMRARAARVLGR